MPLRHLLVGSGPASIAAAEAIRSRDLTAEITCIGAEPEGYYSRPGLAYYLAKEVPEGSLFPFTDHDTDALGITFVPGTVVSLDRAARTVTLESGRTLPYDRLLLATGSIANPVHVPGGDLDGVVKLDDLRDARDLARRAGRGKAAVVVGGGITALEIVEGLCSRHVDVHYLMRKRRYWGNVLSETESLLVEDGLRQRGVEIHYDTRLAEILGDRGKVTGVRTESGDTIHCDMVAVAIGVHPRVELANDAGLECARGVLVDEFLATSDPDIYAAGDIAEVFDPGTQRRSLEVLWSSAVAKGRIAGLNMASGPIHAYDGGAPLNVTRLAGFKLTIMGTVGGGEDSDLEGIVRGDSEAWRQAGEATMVESQAGDAHVRLALGTDTIVGGVVMGDQALSFPLQDLIGARADVGAVIERLKEPGAPIARIVDDFWTEWSARA